MQRFHSFFGRGLLSLGIALSLPAWGQTATGVLYAESLATEGLASRLVPTTETWRGGSNATQASVMQPAVPFILPSPPSMERPKGLAQRATLPSQEPSQEELEKLTMMPAVPKIPAHLQERLLLAQAAQAVQQNRKVSDVPEPGTFALIASLGAIGMAGWMRQRRRQGR